MTVLSGCGNDAPLVIVRFINSNGGSASRLVFESFGQRCTNSSTKTEDPIIGLKHEWNDIVKLMHMELLSHFDFVGVRFETVAVLCSRFRRSRPHEKLDPTAPIEPEEGSDVPSASVFEPGTAGGVRASVVVFSLVVADPMRASPRPTYFHAAMFMPPPGEAPPAHPTMFRRIDEPVAPAGSAGHMLVFGGYRSCNQTTWCRNLHTDAAKVTEGRQVREGATRRDLRRALAADSEGRRGSWLRTVFWGARRFRAGTL